MLAPLPATISIDGKEVRVQDLSDKAQKLLGDLLYAEAQIKELEAGIRMLQLARKGLKEMFNAEISIG